jgi:C1A family cysteine protease
MRHGGYGWVRDHPDFRDVPYASAITGDLPQQVERFSLLPPIYNQGYISSCTGNGTARALQYCRRMQGLPEYIPSRLMLYWNARRYEGTTTVDSGAQIRDAIRGAAQYGACSETIWPYDEPKFRDKPSEAAYAAGKTDEAIGYRRVGQTLNAIRACLASGDPIVFGFSVFESFESDIVAATGVVPIPQPSEGFLGGHCVVAVGYDNLREAIFVDNSWGTGWGIQGSFWMPYAYITSPQLAGDLWSIRLVTEPADGRGT